MALSYTAPVDEYLFLMNEVFAASDIDPAEAQEILSQAARFFEGEWAPLYESGDDEGCQFDGAAVTVPSGFKAAYKACCEAGWNASGEESGLPELLLLALKEFSSASNMSLGLYMGLTNGALSTVRRTGDQWMLDHVVPKMGAGEWTGTMCLTEPGCGTDLRLMKTRAAWEQDGSYVINGTKIFISGGDHDMTDNIVHLVLAKLPDASGHYSDDLSSVSLFLVPKYLVDPYTGEIGARNGVVTGGIERKMGIKGSSTCTLHFENAVGYRLGQLHGARADGAKSSSAGMSGMFAMMNKARLGTGVQALGVAGRGLQNATAYARERCVGRAADPVDRTSALADPILVHPDVRRLLLRQGAFVESARALAAWVYSLMAGKECSTAEEGQQLSNLLTPVVKAFFSDRGFDSANDAMQVLGGHGYIKDNGLEQIARDLRILQLYEGANGVQAFDLVTRKLNADGGSGFSYLISRVQADTERLSTHEVLGAYARRLSDAAEIVNQCAQWLSRSEFDSPYDRAGGAYDFLTMMGIFSCAYMWLRMLERAQNTSVLRKGQADRKRALAAYWFDRELVLLPALAARVRLPAEGLMRLEGDLF